MESSIIEVKDLPAAVRDELVKGHHAKMAMARVNQARIGAASHRTGGVRGVEGLGQLRARVDADVFFRMRQIHGEDCWKDGAFLKSFLAKNPEARVRYNPKARITR